MRFSTLFFFCVLLCPSLCLRAQVDVLTQHNNIQRTGWNNQETQLNTKNVRAGFFGKLYAYTVDDQMYAQPLVVNQVNIPGAGNRNIVYAATVANSVYAFDADSLRAAGPYWQISLNPAGTRPPKNSDMTGACGGGYKDFSGNIGIVGTPVIDKTSGTMYLVSRSLTTDGSNVFTQYLHALDIRTGVEKTGSPVQITAQINGTGSASVNGVITFDLQRQNQRPGLLLLNGIVYIAYSSHCDWQPYHGWVLGYDATTLQQRIVYNDTPDGSEGGIWISGGAPSADAAGNIYLSTGNGTAGLNGNLSDITNRGESLVKLTPSGNTLQTVDFFTPNNFDDLEGADLDFGASEVMLIPGIDRAFTGCKDGRVYLADINNLGRYNAAVNNVVQSVDLGGGAHLRSSFSYYGGTAKQFVYTWSENNNLKAWPVDQGAGNLDLVNVVTSGLQGPQGNNGANMAVSSNGSVDSTAVLWVSHANNCDANQSVCPGILRAVNANDVTKELWNTTVNPADNLGSYAKFVCPTVTNGKLYMATFSGQLVVYGLANNGIDTCNSPNVALNKKARASSQEQGGTSAPMAFDGSLTTRWSSLFTDSEWVYVDLGQKYDLCRVVLHWENAFGKNFDIQVSDDSITWTTIVPVRGNTSLDNILNVQASGRYVKMQGITRNTQFGYSIFEMEVYGTPAPTCITPADLKTTSLQQNSVTLNWDAVPNAAGYTIKYKSASDASFTTVTSTVDSVQLQALSCGTDYIYQVTTNCTTGGSSAFASAAFSTPACTATCGPLPTRWTTSDIGAVGVAGQACFDGNTFSLQGSGADIGGTSDAFRFAYVTLAVDEQFVARVVTQDAADPDDKTGIMMRSTLTPDAPFAFIAVTSGQGAVFEYRSVTGGPVTSVIVSGISSPYWVKMVKTGTVYTAFVSPDGFTWTQAGPAIDLGFGNTAIDAGLAITSHNNSVLSTATLDNFSQTTGSTALPVSLISFSGQSTGKTVALQWSTAMEQNSDHFEVERSPTGGTILFNTVATVKAAGNSYSIRQYTAQDAQPLKGLNYYRLKQVDIDGKYTYSPVILVRSGKEVAPLLFPNPTNAFFTLVAGDDPIRESAIYDLSGKMLLRIRNQAGGTTMTVPCNRLAAGIYLVEIRTTEGRFVQKIIKQ